MKTARPFLGAVQIVTHSGDKHLMKYMADPAATAARILCRRRPRMIDLQPPPEPPQPPAPVPAGWEGILQPGEQILWQGQPRAGDRMGTLSIMRASSLVWFFGGFAAFWILMAA